LDVFYPIVFSGDSIIKIQKELSDKKRPVVYSSVLIAEKSKKTGGQFQPAEKSLNYYLMP